MLLTMALMLASPETRLDQLIVEWCEARAPKNTEICVNRQKRGLQQFISARAAVGDKARVAEVACLKRGAATPSINWTKAASCMEWRRDSWQSNVHTAPNPPAPTGSFASIGWVPVSYPRNG